MNRNTHFLIVGLGLIGGCYARRLTALGYTVDALDIDPGALDYAKEEGIIARTSIEGTSSICYRFLPDAPEDVYFFLKCEECGNLSPIDCGELQKLYEHVIEHHHVRINPTKTVLYGLCEACLARRGE